MKYQKYILGALMVGSMAGTFTSCSDDFINEELINAQSTSFFQTREGLNSLITGTYSALKYKFNYSTWSYYMWPMGTDEFTDAANISREYNGYMLNASDGNIGNLWDNMFNRIESANIALKYADTALKGTPELNTRKGEAHFLRAFCFFQLVQQYGGVPLKITPTEDNITTEFERASAKDCYAQIIKDFEEAYNLLPLNKDKEATGRITKEAAAHFIAKAKIFRQSEINADWNAEYKKADLEDIIKKADEVIAAHPLCDDFVELWDYHKANDANETAREVVLAAQFSDDSSTWGRFGNQMHLAYPAIYQTMPGMTRDIAGGREFCYLRTTNYTLDVFDRVNDSRFWKSFITTYGCNKSSSAPKWAEVEGATLPAGAVVGQPRFKSNELSIKYIINDAGDNEYTQSPTKAEGAVLRNGEQIAAHTFVRYYKGDQENWYSIDGSKVHGNYGHINAVNKFVAMSKFRDGYRLDYNNQFGTRDGIIARSAEDYLFKAEAYARQGDYPACVKALNELRKRASYKPGEHRERHIDGGQAYKTNPYCTKFGTGNGGRADADGSSYYDTNTYFESNKLEGQEEAINATGSSSAFELKTIDDILNSERDNKIYNALTDKTNFGSDVTFSKVMNFILNERTRELVGEMQRWIDLARCKAIKGRWEAFNDGCGREGKSKFEDYMYYRPIPQKAYLDIITNSNSKIQQNPGY